MEHEEKEYSTSSSPPAAKRIKYSESQLEKMPDQIILEMISNLGLKDAQALAKTSRRLRDFLTQHRQYVHSLTRENLLYIVNRKDLKTLKQIYLFLNPHQLLFVYQQAIFSFNIEILQYLIDHNGNSLEIYKLSRLTKSQRGHTHNNNWPLQFKNNLKPKFVNDYQRDRMIFLAYTMNFVSRAGERKDGEQQYKMLKHFLDQLKRYVNETSNKHDKADYYITLLKNVVQSTLNIHSMDIIVELFRNDIKSGDKYPYVSSFDHWWVDYILPIRDPRNRHDNVLIDINIWRWVLSKFEDQEGIFTHLRANHQYEYILKNYLYEWRNLYIKDTGVKLTPAVIEDLNRKIAYYEEEQRKH